MRVGGYKVLDGSAHPSPAVTRDMDMFVVMNRPGMLMRLQFLSHLQPPL
jgi:hypothetical protein